MIYVAKHNYSNAYAMAWLERIQDDDEWFVTGEEAHTPPSNCLPPDRWENWTLGPTFSVVPHVPCAGCDRPVYGLNYLCSRCREW